MPLTHLHFNETVHTNEDSHAKQDFSWAWSLSGDNQFVTEHKENTCADLFLLASPASWSKPSNDHVPPFPDRQSQPLPNWVWPMSWGMILTNSLKGINYFPGWGSRRLFGYFRSFWPIIGEFSAFFVLFQVFTFPRWALTGFRARILSAPMAVHIQRCQEHDIQVWIYRVSLKMY